MVKTEAQGAKPNYRSAFKVSAHVMAPNIPLPQKSDAEAYIAVGKYTLISPAGGTGEQHGKDGHIPK